MQDRPSAAQCHSGEQDTPDRAQVSAYWNAQAQAYLQPGSAGWIMWSLKMENGGIWSLQACYNGVRCEA